MARSRKSTALKRYSSGALAAVHETAAGLHEAGVISKRTMKSFDVLCLTPVMPLSPGEIRLREKASQAVFARHLNVTTGLVSQWELAPETRQNPRFRASSAKSARAAPR